MLLSTHSSMLCYFLRSFFGSFPPFILSLSFFSRRFFGCQAKTCKLESLRLKTFSSSSSSSSQKAFLPRCNQLDPSLSLSPFLPPTSCFLRRLLRWKERMIVNNTEEDRIRRERELAGSILTAFGFRETLNFKQKKFFNGQLFVFIVVSFIICSSFSC